MPDITFILPHFIYWGGLVAVPLFFLFAARRFGGAVRHERLSLPLAYFFWLVSGFMGIHRLYLKSAFAAVFIALFVGVIFCNYGAKQTRNEHSIVKNEAFNAGYDLTLAIDEDAGDDVISALREDVAAKNARQEQLAKRLEMWHDGAGIVALIIFILLVVDGFLMPKLTARQNKLPQRHSSHAPPPDDIHCPKGEDENKDGKLTMFERTVGMINKNVGEFAAYWTVAAVFVFYYEVIARYVFNSPTVWAHESMFLMFGMQYLLAGGFCLREGAHVRVDVLYMHLSPKVKAMANVATSFFFFVFAAVLMVTGWIFFWDSYSIGQVSHTEWQIPHYPIKFALPLGGLLLLLQGLALFVGDVRTLQGRAKG